MIETLENKLDPKQYFKLLILIFIKKQWWVLTVLWLCCTYALFINEKDSFDLFIIFFSILYPVFLLIYFWNYAHSKDNRIFFLSRTYQIDSVKLIGKLNDGSESVINKNHIIKVLELKNFFLLYISQKQFINIQKNSFKSESDKKWFESEFLKNISKK